MQVAHGVLGVFMEPEGEVRVARLVQVEYGLMERLAVLLCEDVSRDEVEVLVHQGILNSLPKLELIKHQACYFTHVHEKRTICLATHSRHVVNTLFGYDQ